MESRADLFFLGVDCAVLCCAVFCRGRLLSDVWVALRGVGGEFFFFLVVI